MKTRHAHFSYWMKKAAEEYEKARRTKSPNAIHDLRVALRHCLTLVSSLQRKDPRKAAYSLIEKISGPLFKSLGKIRDLDVKEEWISKLSFKGRVSFLSFLDKLRKKEIKNLKFAFQAFPILNWQCAEKFFHQEGDPRLSSRAAKKIAADYWKKAHKFHLKSLRDVSPKKLHRLRIAFKKFRYHLEIFCPKFYRYHQEKLKKIQKKLGNIHDLFELEKFVKNQCNALKKSSRKKFLPLIKEERQKNLKKYFSLAKKKTWRAWERDFV